MNCVELQDSLVEIEDGGSAEQQAHLKACRDCSALLAELNLIASSASELSGAYEPSPRVWNSIEIALRQKGLIHPQKAAERRPISSFGLRWGWARWMVPAAAALLITVGVYIKQHSPTGQLARNIEPTGVTQPIVTNGLNDDELMQEVADQTPVVIAQYRANLQSVNEYISDAKSSLDADPGDEDARRSLMEAYQQKSMLFEMAMDRSLQ